MKIILIFLTLFAMAFLLVNCKHQPKFSADNLPPQQLRWGSGGGYVGQSTTFTLLNNGQIFKQGLKDNLAESGKVKAKTAKAIYKTAESIGFSKLEFDHPGNLYYFLEWQDGDVISRITWGDNNHQVDPSVKALYETLNGLIKPD